MSRSGILGWLIGLVALAVAAPGCTPGSGEDDHPRDVADVPGDGTDAGPPPPDADGDTISDADEGRSAGTDTDGDTTPDWQDLDSDGDTIPDATEAGDRDTRSPPWDNDADGIPNFRDIDSDGNGIFDAVDSTDDLDGDGLLDFMDQDDDGDAIGDQVEIAGNPSDPPDFEGDGIPDYRDTDSDNDFIGDRDESTNDTDSDTVPDRFDDDSDHDTWSDEEEAGDADLLTPPVDSDSDTVADYRDPDSDADGLADDLEREHGTERTDPDSDDDDVSDMIEVAAGTDPRDDTDSPRTRGNFVFLEPYNDPADPPDPPLLPDPEEDTLVFSTNLQFADVYFLVDCTGSMYSEIDNLRIAIRGTLIPGIRDAIPNTWVGVGQFDDLPVSPYGGGSDNGYSNLQSITDDVPAAQDAADRLPEHGGADGPESHVVAMYTAITGDHTRTIPAIPAPSCPDGTWGYACFREGAVPIIILMSDSPFHNGPGGSNAYTATVGGITPPSYDEMLDALLARGVKVIGVNSGDSYGRDNLTQIAIDTGAVDADGNPLEYDIAYDGSGLGDEVIRAVETLASAVPIRVDAVPADDPSDAVDAVAEFIDYIEANASGESITDPVTGEVRVCTTTDPLPIDDPADGHPDYFPSVLPGTSVCFDIHARINRTVPATREPQMFMATIQVMGDRITILDERDVYFLVPPAVEIIIE